MKPALIPTVQAILDRVSSLTGKGFEFREKIDLPVYAALKLARSGMPAHIIYTNPRHDEVINHLVAHECGHALRMWSVPEEQRLIPKSGEENRKIALNQIEGDSPELSQGLPYKKLPRLFNSLFQGLVLQLTSMPPDIMIEYWLFDDYPDLRPYQQMSLRRQRDESVRGLNSQSSQVAPAKIAAASHTMSYCFFRLVGLHTGQNLVGPYGGSAYVNRGKELAEITTREYRNDYLGDIAMTNRWAAFFELQEWFSWTGFEDVPPDYVDTA